MKIYILGMIACSYCFAALFTDNATADEGGKTSRPSDQGNMISAQGAASDLILSISLPLQAAVGKSVPLKMTITNQKTRPVKYGYRAELRAFRMAVTDKAGKPVPLTRWGKIWLGQPRWLEERFRYIIEELSPGQSITDEANLSRYFDLTIIGEYVLTVDWEAEHNSQDHGLNVSVNLPFTVSGS